MMNYHKPPADRSFGRWFVFLVLLLSFAGGARSQIFTDWTTFDPDHKTVFGTLGSTSVTLTWDSAGTVNPVCLDGTSTGFSLAAFTPALATSDALEFRGYPSSPVYTITFGVPVVNPILHIASLASILTFSGATPIEISSDHLWSVSGNQVFGYDGETLNAYGTIKFLGEYASLSFTAYYARAWDGIGLQVGATAVPEPAASAALLGAAALSLVLAWHRRRRV
jgi:hypothetical protein